MRRVVMPLILGALLVAGAVMIWRGVRAPGETPGPGTRQAARIVSLAPSVTEILFALGAGDQVVGVTDWCDYPPEAAQKPKVGGHIDFSIERVVGLSPDLVFGAHGIPLEHLHRLRSLGFRVLAENPADFNETMAQILRVGSLVGRQEAARGIVAGMLRDIDAVTRRVEGRPRPRVMYGSWEAPVFVAGPDNFIDEAIRLAGGTNIAADAGTPWPVGYSIERIVGHDPEIIVRGYYPATGVSMGEKARSIADLQADPVWGRITAVRTGRVYWIDENLLVRPGPRLTQGLKELARLIHPERFEVPETAP